MRSASSDRHLRVWSHERSTRDASRTRLRWSQYCGSCCLASDGCSSATRWQSPRLWLLAATPPNCRMQPTSVAVTHAASAPSQRPAASNPIGESLWPMYSMTADRHMERSRANSCARPTASPLRRSASSSVCSSRRSTSIPTPATSSCTSSAVLHSRHPCKHPPPRRRVSASSW